MHSKKTAFVVEHDFIMATYLADRVIVFDGQPSVKARANAPEGLLTGCNKFLKSLDVTFRRDPNSYRPRINKLNSQLDQEQKLNGNYVRPLHALYRYILCALADPPQFFLEEES
jgi:ATP-binding cassette subfamily E protein 1